MGRKAGLNVAETRTIDGEDYHILLSKRFDRNGDGKRIHFASALTLLGLTTVTTPQPVTATPIL